LPAEIIGFIHGFFNTQSAIFGQFGEKCRKLYIPEALEIKGVEIIHQKSYLTPEVPSRLLSIARNALMV